MPPNGESTKVQAMRGVEALGTMVADNDRLIAENDRLKTNSAIMRERCNQLESRLATAETSRDHYMRFATELVTKLNDIEMLIADAIRGAKVVAFKPPKVPVPKTDAPQIDTTGIESLIARLPQNGGSKDAVK